MDKYEILRNKLEYLNIFWFFLIHLVQKFYLLFLRYSESIAPTLASKFRITGNWKLKPKAKIKTLNDKLHFIKKYSNKHLFEESNLFFDWYLPLFLSKKKASNIKIRSKKILSKLYNKLNFSNAHFVHRDFHASNLMEYKKKIAIIDNQDASYGNHSYDLASLIDDVRLKTSNSLKEKVFKYYLKQNKFINKSDFKNDFVILELINILLLESFT